MGGINMSSKRKLKESDVFTNTGKTFYINGKKKYVKPLSLGVSRLVMVRIIKLLEIMDFDFSKYKNTGSSPQQMLTAVYNTLSSWTTMTDDESLNLFSEILSLVLNNKNPEKYDEKTDVTPEEVAWETPLSTIVETILYVLQVSKINDFIPALIQLISQYDVENIITGNN